jgi:hypothetical protein
MFNTFLVYRTPTLTVPPNHEYLDERTGALAAMLAKRAPGYTGLGFLDPRRTMLTQSASTDGATSSEPGTEAA